MGAVINNKATPIEVLNSASGSAGVSKTINETVSNRDFDSKRYQVQADDLLKNGVINEDARKALTEADM